MITNIYISNEARININSDSVNWFNKLFETAAKEPAEDIEGHGFWSSEIFENQAKFSEQPKGTSFLQTEETS